MADTFDAEAVAREHGLTVPVSNPQEPRGTKVLIATTIALNAAFALGQQSSESYRRGREDGLREAAEVVKGKGAYGGGMIHREVTLAKIEAALTTKEPQR